MFLKTSFNKTFLMEIYIKLFEVLFPVFFIVSIGYFLGKKIQIDTHS